MSDRVCGHTDPRSCDIDCRIEELERIVHPEGRCEVCGGGKPYWKHLDPSADGYHAFIGRRGYEPVQRVAEEVGRDAARRAAALGCTHIDRCPDCRAALAQPAPALDVDALAANVDLAYGSHCAERHGSPQAGDRCSDCKRFAAILRALEAPPHD